MQFVPGHANGRVRLGYVHSGDAVASLVTCGTDGKIRTAPADSPGEEAKVVTNREDAPIYALAVHPVTGVVATGDEAAFVRVRLAAARRSRAVFVTQVLLPLTTSESKSTALGSVFVLDAFQLGAEVAEC